MSNDASHNNAPSQGTSPPSEPLTPLADVDPTTPPEDPTSEVVEQADEATTARTETTKNNWAPLYILAGMFAFALIAWLRSSGLM
jgi:hypothetical protein